MPANRYQDAGHKVASALVVRQTFHFIARNRRAVLRAIAKYGDVTRNPLITIEFLLLFLIARSGITRRDPERRLNAFENLMWLQVQRCRPFAPITPETDLLMAGVTRDALLEWVVAGVRVPETLGRRLDVYRSTQVILGTVRPGWIRLVLA